MQRHTKPLPFFHSSRLFVVACLMDSCDYQSSKHGTNGDLVVNNFQIELDSRIAKGMPPKTRAEVYAALKVLGYNLCRENDCPHIARYMTGERAGFSYPSCSLYPVQIDNGLSFANADARRDDNFRALQAMRFSGEWYWIHNNRFYEL